jgi:hypothetical protein
VSESFSKGHAFEEGGRESEGRTGEQFEKECPNERQEKKEKKRKEEIVLEYNKAERELRSSKGERKGRLG